MNIVARPQNLHSQVKMSQLKHCVAKSAAQISIQLSGTQMSGDLNGVLAIRSKQQLRPMGELHDSVCR